jgi:NAD(P)-dependent dehydrogenase (short-subunit alcohol dehydrogenase family)
MQKGQHIGKLVVHIPENNINPDVAHTSIDIATTKRPLKLDSSAVYLLAGGMGGLGRAIATYLIECGARHLIFLSRSAASSATSKEFFLELESQDCTVSAIDGSVANLADVQKAVAIATNSGKRLAGVLQLSMVLRDLPLMKMSHKDWRTAIEPKVDGTRNLHKVSLELDGNELDFFVMFSSALGNFGAAHQSK